MLSECLPQKEHLPLEIRTSETSFFIQNSCKASDTIMYGKASTKLVVEDRCLNVVLFPSKNRTCVFSHFLDWFSISFQEKGTSSLFLRCTSYKYLGNSFLKERFCMS